jgi:Zn-dependent protease with chaperone function
MSANSGLNATGTPSNPHPGQTPAKTAQAKPTLQALLNALPKEFDRPQPPPGYISALKLAIGIQAALLIVYLLSMAGFLFLCFYRWPASLADSGMLGALLAVSPVLLGLIVLFFMIKPFFWSSKTNAPPVEVTPEDQPILFAYVNRICELVGAPKPARIRVTADANASASFENPFTDLATKRFVLTLGLPLVSGLSLNQLTGVIAHEFGHFNQHAGFLVSTVSGWINGSIARIVLERDRIDELMDATSRSHILLRSLMFIPRFANWINRGVLWLMMILSYALVSRTFREAEFDADQYSSRMAGTKDFENTFKRIYILSHGVQQSFQHLTIWAQDKRLPDDTVYLSVAGIAQMDIKVKNEVIQQVIDRPTKWYDTHPCHAERVAQAVQTQYPALVKFNGPATVLFEKYSDLCRKATSNVYEQALGKEVSKHRIISAREMAKEKGSDDEAVKALDRYFQGYYSIFRPVFPRKVDSRAPQDPAKTKEAITLIRNRMVSAANSNVDRLNQLTRLENELISAQMAISLMDQGHRINIASFKISAHDVGSASSKVGYCQQALEDLDKEMTTFDNDARRRLELALPLLFDDKVMGHMPLDELLRLRTDTSRFLAAATGIEPVFPIIKRIGRRMEVFHELFALIMQTGDSGIVQLLIKENKNILADMHRVSEKLLSVSYPFSLDSSTRTVADYLAEIYPDVEDIGGVIACADSLLAKFKLLTYRLLSKLVLTAETIETRMGLPLLESPDNNDPLAELSKQIEKKHEKVEEAKQEAAMHADLFYGDNARAAAVGVLMMVILFYYFIVSPFTSSASPSFPRSKVSSESAQSSYPDVDGQPVRPPLQPARSPARQPVTAPVQVPTPAPTPIASAPKPLPPAPKIASGPNAKFKVGQIILVEHNGRPEQYAIVGSTDISAANMQVHDFRLRLVPGPGESPQETISLSKAQIQEIAQIIHEAPDPGDAPSALAPATPRQQVQQPVQAQQAQADPPASKDRIKPGQKVSAYTDGRWTDATVVDRQGDSFTLSIAYPNWADETYPYSSIRLAGKSVTGPSQVASGNAIDVLWGSSWSPARIVSANASHAVIRWDQSANSTFQASLDNVKPLPQPTPQAGKVADAGASASQAPSAPPPSPEIPAIPSPPNAPTAPQHSPSHPTTSLTYDDVKVGDTLWVRASGVWEQGRVTKKLKAFVMIRLDNATVDRAVPYNMVYKEKPQR